MNTAPNEGGNQSTRAPAYPNGVEPGKVPFGVPMNPSVYSFLPPQDYDSTRQGPRISPRVFTPPPMIGSGGIGSMSILPEQFKRARMGNSDHNVQVEPYLMSSSSDIGHACLDPSSSAGVGLSRNGIPGRSDFDVDTDIRVLRPLDGSVMMPGGGWSSHDDVGVDGGGHAHHVTFNGSIERELLTDALRNAMNQARPKYGSSGMHMQE